MAEQLSLRRGFFFGIGNPLIDLRNEEDDSFFIEHGLNKNEAILAGPEHAELFKVLREEAGSTIGGSSQNVLRTVAWFLQQKSPIATYMGCVGDDFEKDRLEKLAEPAGLEVVYQIHPELPTGCCAVLISKQDGQRTMVTELGASEAFQVDFLLKNWSKVQEAQVLCSEGFFFLSCREAFMRICEHAFKKRKIFSLTLSAKFICNDPYGVCLLSALPYADIVFGYEDEAKALVQTQLGVQTSDVKNIVEKLRDCPKWNTDRPRIVVISKVPKRTTVGTRNGTKVYQWKRPASIIDTYGCGAALAGGFLAYLALDKPIDECINAGLYCAYEILQRRGCQFPDEHSFKDEPYYKTDEEE